MGGQRTAAIVGAGIGGLAAGIALQGAGYDVTHYEKYPEPSGLGAGLGIWPNGVRALRALGLEELTDEAIDQGGGIRRADGSLLAGFAPAALERRHGEPLLAIHRGELHAALLGAVGRQRVEWGREVTAVEGGELRCADGTRVGADLIVGADGINSAVRQALLGDGEPRDAGIVAHRGVVEFAGEVPAGEWWGRDCLAGLLPLRGGRVYWYFGSRGGDGPGLLERLVAEFDPVVGKVVALTPREEILIHQLYDRAPVDSWSRGNATLLGDAAHPMLPFVGQGACSALEDAVVLGREVGGHDDVAAALVAYERARARRAALLVKVSRRAASMALPRSAAARRLRDLLMPRLPESVRLRQLDRLIDWSP